MRCSVTCGPYKGGSTCAVPGDHSALWGRISSSNTHRARLHPLPSLQTPTRRTPSNYASGGDVPEDRASLTIKLDRRRVSLHPSALLYFQLRSSKIGQAGRLGLAPERLRGVVGDTGNFQCVRDGYMQRRDSNSDANTPHQSSRCNVSDVQWGRPLGRSQHMRRSPTAQLANCKPGSPHAALASAALI